MILIGDYQSGKSSGSNISLSRAEVKWGRTRVHGELYADRQAIMAAIGFHTRVMYYFSPKIQE